MARLLYVMPACPSCCCWWCADCGRCACAAAEGCCIGQEALARHSGLLGMDCSKDSNAEHVVLMGEASSETGGAFSTSVRQDVGGHIGAGRTCITVWLGLSQQAASPAGAICPAFLVVNRRAALLYSLALARWYGWSPAACGQVLAGTGRCVGQLPPSYGRWLQRLCGPTTVRRMHPRRFGEWGHNRNGRAQQTCCLRHTWQGRGLLAMG